MENKADEADAGQMVPNWRKIVRQQSTKIAELAEIAVLPKNERTSRKSHENETTEMHSVESHHPDATIVPDNKAPTERKTENFPIFMIGVSLVQVKNTVLEIGIFYSYDVDALTMKFGYDPYRRHELWRFFTTMFVHGNWSHLWGNLVMQLILGVFLEIVHKWKRVAVIYFASALGGNLFVTVLDNASYSVGASDSVMGLLFSHVATIVLNWNEIERKFSRLFCVALYIVYDIGSTVYTDVYLEEDSNISHAAHFGGAVTGFLVSILVLKNLKKRPWEKTLQQICVGVLLTIFVIIFTMNVTLSDYFPLNEWNFDYERTYYEEDSTNNYDNTEQTTTFLLDEMDV